MSRKITIPEFIMIELFIRIPQQMYRFFRWNLIPSKCPDCKTNFLKLKNLHPNEIQSSEVEKYPKTTTYDFLICQCGHFKNLDEKYVRYL